MRRLALALAIFAGPSVSGCALLDVGDATITSTINQGDLAKQMSATIDGVTWFAQVVAIQQSDSTIQFTGVLNPGQTSERTITLQMQKGKTGTQTFGDASGAYAQVVVGNSTLQSWSTRAGGPTGTVTVNFLAANHYTGSFAFDAAANFSDLTPATRRVTGGVFDITF
jgi:hypothetical protein